MTALLIPISDLKTYARLIKKQNPSAKLNQAHVLNVLCNLLGWTDYSNYERHINKAHNLSAAVSGAAISIDRLPLHDLEHHAMTLASRLADELATDHDTVIEMPPSLVVGHRHLPSTPFDKAVRYQVNRLDQLPALRMSGALYLITFFSGLPLFDTTKWHVNWSALIEYLMRDELPSVLSDRLNHHASLNARHGHAYHEGIFETARASLLTGSLDQAGFVERIQGVLTHEQSYLASAQLRLPTQEQPKFTFPVAQDTSNYTQTLALISDIRRLTSASQPLLLGTPRLFQRTMTSDGVIREKRLSKWLDHRRPLTISTHALKKNLLFIGATGSSRSMATHFLLHQALINNAGAIIIDAKASPQDHWSIQSIAKVHGKENNASLLTINHQDQLRHLNLTDSICKKRIRHLLLPSLAMPPSQLNTHVFSILDRLTRTVPRADNQLEGREFPYLIILNDVMSAIITEDDLAAFKHFLDRMNRSAVAVILSVQHLRSPLKSLQPTLADHFGSYLIMCQDNTDNMPVTLDADTSMDIRNQVEGEFRYATAQDGIDATPYQFPFPAPELAHYLYLVMD